jgi:hypothetical protein
VEYRTLSNFWIFKKKHIEWVWRATAAALNHVQNGFDVKEMQLIGNDIRQAINKNDRILAEQLVDEFKLEVV